VQFKDPVNNRDPASKPKPCTISMGSEQIAGIGGGVRPRRASYPARCARCPLVIRWTRGFSGLEIAPRLIPLTPVCFICLYPNPSTSGMGSPPLRVAGRPPPHPAPPLPPPSDSKSWPAADTLLFLPGGGGGSGQPADALGRQTELPV
jgi:hypothetical protein